MVQVLEVLSITFFCVLFEEKNNGPLEGEQGVVLLWATISYTICWVTGICI